MPCSMTTTQSRPPASARPTVLHGYDTALLPGPTAVHGRLTGLLLDRSAPPRALILLGLLRRGASWSLAPSTLSTVTAVIARNMRADDWIGRSAIGDLSVVIDGSADAAATMALRLTRVVNDLGIPALGACAGIAALQPGTDATTVMDRAAGALQVARETGAGAVLVAGPA
jgi:hypothetical protein